MIYYLKGNGYWEDPSDVYPEGAVQVPKRTSMWHDWDGSQWVFNTTRAKEECAFILQSEFERIQKFWRLPQTQFDLISADLSSYTEALRQYVKTLDENSVKPECPVSLTDANYFDL